jgi:hypothetical protein
VSRRRVLEAVFVLLESPSPLRRIFIGSHSLPPLWFAVSVLHPRSLGGMCALLQGFFRSVVIVRGVCFSRPRRCHTHVLTFACVRCISRRCSLASSPRACARSRQSGRALRLICTPLRRPSAGRRVRFPQLRSSGSRIAGSPLSCYRVIQVDAHAPFDKGRLVVRRLVHESAYVGVLGRAWSRSLGTEGAEALPRWDPSTSCPRWLLNTTCGVPSSW